MRSYWENLSERERRLATMTGSILVLALVFLIGYRAAGNLTRLDSRVAQLEQELVNLRQQEAQSASAEVAFQSMAAQHSSTWTEAEIQDRLRVEIYRLALSDEDTPNPTQEDYMVQIPTLRAGTLLDEDEGYREYQLAFRLEPSPVMNVVRFVERLQKSNQSLRVDKLDLARAPMGALVETTLEITRTVLDSDTELQSEAGPVGSALLADGGFEAWDSREVPTQWTIDGVRVSRNEERSTEGTQSLEAMSTRKGGALYAPVRIAGGRTYRLSMDVSSESPVVLGVHEPGAPGTLTRGRSVPGDGGTYHCEILFTPTGDDAGAAEVWAPYLQIEDSGSRVYLDNVSLTPVGG